MAKDQRLLKKFEAIAHSWLGIDTLENRHSDRLDFHDVHVTGVVAALEAAYQLGAEERMPRGRKIAA